MTNKNVIFEKRSLSWKELGLVYNSMTGKHYTDLKDGELVNWALKQKDKFQIDVEGVHLLVQKVGVPGTNMSSPEEKK